MLAKAFLLQLKQLVLLRLRLLNFACYKLFRLSSPCEQAKSQKGLNYQNLKQYLQSFSNQIQCQVFFTKFAACTGATLIKHSISILVLNFKRLRTRKIPPLDVIDGGKSGGGKSPYTGAAGRTFRGGAGKFLAGVYVSDEGG